MSGFGFVGGPGLVYRMGMASFWMAICVPIAYVLCFALLAKRLRLLAELKEPVSLPDAVAARYGSEGCRFLTAVAILLGVMGYLGTQILAMATVLVDLIAGAGLGTPSLGLGVVFSSAVLIFYCVTGGIIASVYTDLVQGLVMAVAGVLIFLATAQVVPGGWDGIIFHNLGRRSWSDESLGHIGGGPGAQLVPALYAGVGWSTTHHHQVDDEPEGPGRQAHTARFGPGLYHLGTTLDQHWLGHAGTGDPGHPS